MTSRDMTQPADMNRLQGTGPVMVQRPRYQNTLPPCNAACPAGENIQEWLALAQQGQFYEAWQALIRNNPMPGVHGRVCYHPCENACNRGQVDSTVSIHAVERFLGDQALEHQWQVELEKPASGKKVLVIGAGPSGLSAAFHLRRLGHQVEIRDAGPMAGGMMRFGIPAYRLPRDVLDGEIKRIEDMGVKLTLNHKVEDIQQEKADGNFAAVFVAIGAHLAKKIHIPAREAGKIMDAVSYLEQVETGNAPQLGRRVAIYGGGNTAMDAARTAKRMGAEEAMIIYRRDREQMPAHDFEALEAEEEGIKINWLRTISDIDQSDFKVEVMELDAAGKPQPTGRFETLQADSLILALGQNVDMSVLRRVEGLTLAEDGVVKVDSHFMTTAEGIFAGGDMVPSERTVTIATGHGKRAARNIDAWLRGQIYTHPASPPPMDFSHLQLWYRTDAEISAQPSADAQERTQDFSEIIGGLTDSQAQYEAQRCYSCGNCFECDGCFGACPENAIRKLGPGKGYEIDMNKCTGCQACYLQCPCHAIEMVNLEGSSHA